MEFWGPVLRLVAFKHPECMCVGGGERGGGAISHRDRPSITCIRIIWDDCGTCSVSQTFLKPTSSEACESVFSSVLQVCFLKI